jgi:heme oxygenase
MIPPNSLRDQIYSLTKPIHDRLDGDPDSVRAIQPTATRDDFVHLLKRTYGFVKPVEEALVAQNKILAPVFKFETRAEIVLEDLRVLGVRVAGLPVMSSTPTIQTVGHAMGVAYVLEGSKMGGLVIAKQVSRFSGIESRFFLPGEPKSVVKEFQAFCAKLDVFARCECDERDAVDAAIETFALIDAWFVATRQRR